MSAILENNKNAKQAKKQSDEKEAIIALSVIIAGIFLIAIGIQVGKWSVVILKVFGV